MVQIMGKFGLKVGVNGMEDCKGNGKIAQMLGRSKALNACQDLGYIKQSKTDSFRQGHTITIAKSLSPIFSEIAMKDSFKLSHHVSTLCSPLPDPDNGLHRTISQQSLEEVLSGLHTAN